jgi:hypothetical protein
MARLARQELARMSKCKNCGVEIGPEETCVFATYKTTVGDREIIVCCPNCASDLEQAAAQPAVARPAKKAPAKKAPRKVKRAGRSKKAPKKAPRKSRRVGKAKKATRKPARRTRK